jgi:hypothetical protein
MCVEGSRRGEVLEILKDTWLVTPTSVFTSLLDMNFVV